MSLRLALKLAWIAAKLAAILLLGDATNVLVIYQNY
jgi:hypothetical protein